MLRYIDVKIGEHYHLLHSSADKVNSVKTVPVSANIPPRPRDPHVCCDVMWDCIKCYRGRGHVASVWGTLPLPPRTLEMES